MKILKNGLYQIGNVILNKMKKSVWGIILFIAAILLLVIFNNNDLILWLAGSFIILYGLIFVLRMLINCGEIDDEDDYFNGDNPIIKGQGH